IGAGAFPLLRPPLPFAAGEGEGWGGVHLLANGHPLPTSPLRCAQGEESNPTRELIHRAPNGSDHQSQQGEAPMFWTKRVVIGDGERGLVYRNRRFERVLDAGVYRLFDPLNRIEVRAFDIAVPEYAGHDVDVLVARLGGRLGPTFVLADIGADEVGLG